MNNELSSFQDLTLDFVGAQEYLVLVPKSAPTLTQTETQIAPGSAIIARKVTNWEEEVKNSPPNEAENGTHNENLDSQAYNLFYEGNTNGAVNLKTFTEKIKHALDRALNNYPTSAKVLISKKSLTDNFYIIGILNANKLKEITAGSQKSQGNIVSHYIDLFPEYSDPFLNWINAA